MNELTTIKLFKCLADKSRLQILKSLVQEEMYVERLSQRLDLSPSTVSFHLKKLEEVGAVQSKKLQYYTVYSINENVFMVNLLDLITVESSEEEVQKQREGQYKQEVIKHFYKYDELKQLPTQRKKKRIILEEVVKQFEENKEYTEKEVNLILADIYEDFCLLRRNLIEEKLMSRENGKYIKI